MMFKRFAGFEALRHAAPPNPNTTMSLALLIQLLRLPGQLRGRYQAASQPLTGRRPSLIPTSTRSAPISAQYISLAAPPPSRVADCLDRLPEHFPPHQRAYGWFTRFRDEGTWASLNHQLVQRYSSCRV